MEFHRSGWFFKCQARWNSINLVIEISKRSAPLHLVFELGWTAFLASEIPQQWISRKKLWKNNFQKIIFPYLNIDAAFRRIVHVHEIGFLLLSLLSPIDRLFITSPRFWFPRRYLWRVQLHSLSLSHFYTVISHGLLRVFADKIEKFSVRRRR